MNRPLGFFEGRPLDLLTSLTYLTMQIWTYSRYINCSDWDSVLLKKVNKVLMKSSKYGCESTGLRRLLVFAELDLIRATTTNFRSNRYYTSVWRNELPISWIFSLMRYCSMSFDRLMVEMEHQIPEKIFFSIPKEVNEIPQENLEPPLEHDIAEFFFQIPRFAHSVSMLSHFLITGDRATRALTSPRTALFSTVKSRLFSNIYSETKLRTSVLLQGLSRRCRTLNGERTVAYSVV